MQKIAFLSVPRFYSYGLASICEQQCLCGSCGTHHHLPRGPGSLVDLCISHWADRPGYELWTASSPSQPPSVGAWRVLFWRDTHGWESICRSWGFYFLGSAVVKNHLPMQETQVQSLGSKRCSGIGTPTPVFLQGKFHEQRNVVGHGPWGRKELDTTEHVPFLRFSEDRF